MTKDEVMKENVLRLADEHREVCDSSTCTISLSLLADLLRKAGIELSEDEVGRLL